MQHNLQTSTILLKLICLYSTCDYSHLIISSQRLYLIYLVIFVLISAAVNTSTQDSSKDVCPRHPTWQQWHLVQPCSKSTPRSAPFHLRQSELSRHPTAVSRDIQNGSHICKCLHHSLLGRSAMPNISFYLLASPTGAPDLTQIGKMHLTAFCR